MITGAAGGDGISIVKALCSAGMNVIMLTRKAAQAQQVIWEIEQAGLKGSCSYILGSKDQAPLEHQKSTYEKITKEYGHVDLLICNNGDIDNQDDIDMLSPQLLKDGLDRFVVGSFQMLQAALPWLKRSPSPGVIFMTSLEGCCGGTKEGLANAIAKGAVRSLTLNCAARLLKDHINVNCIAKGDCEYSPGHTLAEMVCYLASEEAKDITGQIFGLTAKFPAEIP